MAIDTPKDSRVPLTVLTGFQGAGKTTLLNRILTEQHGKRIAVIKNEFGEVGVDQEIVIGAEEEIFEMINGCICCSVRGDLIRILGNLIKRKDRFDYIMIETTGLADPGPVAQTFFVDTEMQGQLKLDAVVTVVDAKHIALHLDEAPECTEQIAFAEVFWDNTSRYLATGGSSTVTVWDCSGRGPEGSRPLQLEAHENSITAIAFQRNGPLLASGADDEMIHVWAPGRGKKPTASGTVYGGVSQLTRSRDDRLLAVGSAEGSVDVFTAPR